MKMNMTFSERPSLPPATAAFCGLGVADGARAAFLSSVVLASSVSAVQGRSASTAGLVIEHPTVDRADATARKRNGLDVSITQAAVVQQFVSKQISVMPVYRTAGVGGVPPRGRPN